MPCSWPSVLIHRLRALCRWAAIVRMVRRGIPGIDASQSADGICSTRRLVTRLFVRHAARMVGRKSETGDTTWSICLSRRPASI